MADDKKGAQESEKKKGKGLLRWIMLIVLIGALGGGGFFAYQKFVLAPQGQDAAHETAAPDPLADKNKKEAKDVRGVLATLPPFLVNLNDPLGRRYLKLSMDVEVVDKPAAEQLTKSDLAKAKDAIILLLSSKTFQDINTVENKIVMRNEIVERLNQVLGAGKVLKVYFTEIIVQ